MTFQYLNEVTDEQIALLVKHLHKRHMQREKKAGLSIVFDVTYMCNQACPGCCVSAIPYKKGKEITMGDHGSDLERIEVLLRKIKVYVDSRPDLDFFIDFGGGELTLRPDWKQILKLASEMFGTDSVGMNTNGTRATIEDMMEIEPYTSYIGISVDGLEEYHNRWRRTVEGGNSFERTMSLIRQMTSYKPLFQKVDIATVPTRNNIKQIPELMKYLKEIGITNYSVHRTMQVGRLWAKDELVPTREEYFRLLLNIIETNQSLGMDVHLHHSIESMYTALLLQRDTYAFGNLGNPDRKASLGMDPWGRVFFDPWCTVMPWDQLASSSLLDGDITFEAILKQHGGIQDLVESYCRKDIRCKGCDVGCSGGNRIAAAANYIRSNFRLTAPEVTKDILLEAMDSVDPVCPLYLNGSAFLNSNDNKFQGVLTRYHQIGLSCV